MEQISTMSNFHNLGFYSSTIEYALHCLRNKISHNSPMPTLMNYALDVLSKFEKCFTGEVFREDIKRDYSLILEKIKSSRREVSQITEISKMVKSGLASLEEIELAGEFFGNVSYECTLMCQKAQRAF